MAAATTTAAATKRDDARASEGGANAGESHVPGPLALVPSTSTPPDDGGCFVCLGGGELLRGACACTSARVHVRCLEVLLNSKARRALPLGERLHCAVCTRAYTVPIGLADAPAKPAAPRGRAWPAHCALLQLAALALLALPAFAVLLVVDNVAVRAVVVALFLCLALGGRCTSLARHCVACARRGGAAPAAPAPEPPADSLPDDAYYELVVRPTRGDAVALCATWHEAGHEAAAEAPPALVHVLLSGGAAAERGPEAV